MPKNGSLGQTRTLWTTSGTHGPSLLTQIEQQCISYICKRIKKRKKKTRIDVLCIWKMKLCIAI